MRRGGMLATVIVVGSMLVGCSGTGAPDEGGFGLGALTAEDALAAFVRAGAAPERLRGTLTVRDDGCFTWSGESGDGAWIVWPDAAESDRDDGGRVVLDGGEVVSDGSALSAEGALIALADLPDGGNPDSYFGAYGGFCDAGSEGVMLLTAVAAG
ncbi:hypothetical protein QF046_000466 [Microbacterium sp. W4I4]|uniref:hypothetical protein n=1 Tax=Microbacterium sp. W4I4 TaxID=3042295 RepID=UPI00277E70BD|nr:hypothetical protein [Microbacterium sp. W4I4]MDQ0612825.1 hypothetical protein [Microbacterium sp. W4I4]